MGGPLRSSMIKTFFENGPANTTTRTNAVMIVTNPLASVQLTRLTNKQDFRRINELIDGVSS